MRGIKKIGLLGALSVCVLLCIYGYFLLWGISESFVIEGPEIAHMRWPILIGCYIMLTGAVVALLLGITSAMESEQEIFSRSTIKCLGWMGRSLSISTVAIVAVYIYAWIQLGSEVGLMGAYLFIFVLLFFTASSVLFFIRDLFARAVEFHDENELTV